MALPSSLDQAFEIPNDYYASESLPPGEPLIIQKGQLVTKLGHAIRWDPEIVLNREEIKRWESRGDEKADRFERSLMTGLVGRDRNQKIMEKEGEDGKDNRDENECENDLEKERKKENTFNNKRDPLARLRHLALSSSPSSQSNSNFQSESEFSDSLITTAEPLWDEITTPPPWECSNKNSPDDHSGGSEQEYWERLRVGRERVWDRYRAEIFIALMYFSLAGGFASPPLVRTLSHPTSSYLTSSNPQSAFRRLLETMNFVIDVLDGKGLERGIEGVREDFRPPERIGRKDGKEESESENEGDDDNNDDNWTAGGKSWQSIVRIKTIHARVRERIFRSDGRVANPAPGSETETMLKKDNDDGDGDDIEQSWILTQSNGDDDVRGEMKSNNNTDHDDVPSVQIPSSTPTSASTGSSNSTLPINQIEMAVTLGSFSIAPFWCLEKMGIKIPEWEKDCFIMLWRHIGWYLGVDPSILNTKFTSYQTASLFFFSNTFYLFSDLPPSPSPPPSSSSSFSTQQLYHSSSPTIRILQALVNQPPLYQSLEYHMQVSRRLLGDEFADKVGLPNLTFRGNRRNVWETLTDGERKKDLMIWLRVELGIIWFGWALTEFGELYGKVMGRWGWEKERRKIMSDVIRLLINSCLGGGSSRKRGKRTYHQMQAKENYDKCFGEDDNKKEGQVRDYKEVVRKWRALIIEMAIFCFGSTSLGIYVLWTVGEKVLMIAT